MLVSLYYNGKIVIYMINNHNAFKINVIGIKIMNAIHLVNVMITTLNFVQQIRIVLIKMVDAVIMNMLIAINKWINRLVKVEAVNKKFVYGIVRNGNAKKFQIHQVVMNQTILWNFVIFFNVNIIKNFYNACLKTVMKIKNLSA